MTVIAAIISGDRVLMGADSFIQEGNRLLCDTQSKLWRLGDMVMGGSGRLLVADAIQYGFRLPPVPEGQSEDAYMRLTLPDTLRGYLQERGLMYTPEGENLETCEASLLIGWRGRIWEVDGNLSVCETVEPYNAIGSGGDIARTALHCLPGSPRERLAGALEAAAQFSVTVSAPFTYLDA